MLIGQAKGAVARVVLPRCIFLVAEPFCHSRAVCSRRMSTFQGGHSGDPTGKAVLAEPDPQVLAILVCPFTKEPLTYDRQARELLSPTGVAFPVTANGIPSMIPASARIIAQD